VKVREYGSKGKEYTMNNIAGLAVLALGVVLLIFGFNESHSFSSDVSRTFTGNPTNHSMWLIIGGAVAVVVGFVLAFTGRKRS
jgi:multisubunit Na+/H+ antiporter MnhB subunit